MCVNTELHHSLPRSAQLAPFYVGAGLEMWRRWRPLAGGGILDYSTIFPTTATLHNGV